MADQSLAHSVPVLTASAVPTPAMAWWAVAVLFVAHVLSFVDRSVISLLVQPIQQDLGISDTKISLLQGLAFSLFYTIAGLPIAVFADRHSRRLIAAAGVAIWSLMTMLCGLASTYAHLFVARVGVGVGEATLGPCSYSLIADTFPETQRGRAMAIFGCGPKVGTGLAFLIGSIIISSLPATGVVETAFGQFRNWQVVFMMVGLPGLVAAALCLTIAEPPRARNPIGRVVQVPLSPFLGGNLRSTVSIFGGMAFFGLMSAALMAWGPTYYIRVHHLTSAEVGARLGPIFAVCGIVGAFCGGAWSDRWSRHGMPDATVRTALLGVLASMIVAPIAVLTTNLWLSLTFFSLTIFFTSIGYPCGAAAVQKLSPPLIRARMAALYLLGVGLISQILGPTSVAVVTDYAFKDPTKIGLSLAVVMFAGGLVTIVFLSSGLRAYCVSVNAHSPIQGGANGRFG